MTPKQNLQSIQRELQLTELSSNNNLESELQKKTDYITQYNSKAYFRKVLVRLAYVIPENATIICDYIIAEQNPMNIKESTKEGKRKVLIWLSNYFQNTKSYNQMTSRISLNTYKKTKTLLAAVFNL